MSNKHLNNEINLRINSTKRFSVYLLVTLVLSVIASIYFYYKEQALSNEIKIAKDQLVEKNNTIAELNQRLAEAVKTQDEHPITKKQEELIRHSENASYSLGFYGYNVSELKYQMVKKYITEEHYSITRDRLLERRTSWLAQRATVFYYHLQAEKKAAKLASELTKLTGTKFSIAKGKGLGVLKGQEKWTFFIHYIED